MLKALIGIFLFAAIAILSADGWLFYKTKVDPWWKTQVPTRLHLTDGSATCYYVLQTRERICVGPRH